jgi:hypothetical protein
MQTPIFVVKKWYGPIIFLFFVSCTDKKLTTPVTNLSNSVEAFVSEYHVNKYAYVIANDKTILNHKFDPSYDIAVEDSSFPIENFAAPVYLKKIIDDNLIDEDSVLTDYGAYLHREKLNIADLIKIPGNKVVVEIIPEEISKIYNDLLQKTTSRQAYEKFAKDQLHVDFSTAKDINEIIISIAKISLYSDSYHFNETISDTGHIADLFPMGAMRNIVYFHGWRIFKFQRNTVLWNFFQLGDKSILALKAVDKDLFIAVAYNSENIRSPFANNRADLLQSPLAISILKSIYFSELGNSIDFDDSKTAIATKLDYALRTGYSFFHLKDLIHTAERFSMNGKSMQADVLFELYNAKCGACIPAKYLQQPVLAAVQYLSDGIEGQRFFELSEPTEMAIFGVGQIKEDVKFNHNNIYQYDNVELFFDIANNKEKTFSMNRGHYQYRFNYQYDKITGFWLSDKNVKFSFADPSDSVYILEIQIPWKTLTDSAITSKRTIGFNIFVADSNVEENKRDNLLSLFVEKENFWNVPGEYGSLRLTDMKKSSDGHGNMVSAVKVKVRPAIDGQIDSVWSLTGYLPINKLIQRLSKHTPVPSASFKALWDDDNLYFLFKVADLIKNRPGFVSADKYWIEDAVTGNIVWKMTGVRSRSFPAYSSKNTIVLPKGRYIVRYHTDEAHSLEGWYSAPPVADNYGIILYKYIE